MLINFQRNAYTPGLPIHAYTFAIAKTCRKLILEYSIDSSGAKNVRGCSDGSRTIWQFVTIVSNNSFVRIICEFTFFSINTLLFMPSISVMLCRKIIQNERPLERCIPRTNLPLPDFLPLLLMSIILYHWWHPHCSYLIFLTYMVALFLCPAVVCAI